MTLSNNPPLACCHNRPNPFDQAKGPRALKETVDRAQQTGNGKTQYKPWATVFECVTDQHRGYRDKSECTETIHAALSALQVLVRLPEGTKQIVLRFTAVGVDIMHYSRSAEGEPTVDSALIHIRRDTQSPVRGGQRRSRSTTGTNRLVALLIQCPSL